MKFEKVIKFIYEFLVQNRDEFTNKIYSVTEVREMVLEKTNRVYNNRQISRALKQLGFYQENKYVQCDCTLRRISFYHFTDNLFFDANIKYNKYK